MKNNKYLKDYIEKKINDEKKYIRNLPSKEYKDQDMTNSWRTTIYDIKLQYFVDRLIETNFFAGFDVNLVQDVIAQVRAVGLKVDDDVKISKKHGKLSPETFINIKTICEKVLERRNYDEKYADMIYDLLDEAIDECDKDKEEKIKEIFCDGLDEIANIIIEKLLDENANEDEMK